MDAEDSSAQDKGTQSGGPRPVEDEFSLVQVLNILLKQRRIIYFWTGGISLLVLLWLLTFGSAVTYTSTASFIPQDPDGNAVGLTDLAGQFGFRIPTGEPGQSPDFYVELIQSRAVVGTIAEEPVRFHVGQGEDLETRSGSLAELMELAEDGSDAQRREAAIRWLMREVINVSAGRETGIVVTSIKTPWAGLSKVLADRLLELINEFNLEIRQNRGAAERAFVEGRLREARDSLRSAENRFEAFLASNRQVLGNRTTSPELLFERDRLERWVTMQQQVYTGLAEAYEQARIAEVRNTPVITVVEHPELPVRADSRGRVLKLILGIMLGGMLGISLAFVREYMDRVREGEEEDYREFARLWSQSRSELRTPRAWFRGGTRTD